MSVTFKCKTTGNTVTFKDQVDIDSMKGHPEYDVVEPEYKGEQVVLPTYEESLAVEPKRVGRPKKGE
jgi:hypothetical protein